MVPKLQDTSTIQSYDTAIIDGDVDCIDPACSFRESLAGKSALYAQRTNGRILEHPHAQAFPQTIQLMEAVGNVDIESHS